MNVPTRYRTFGAALGIAAMGIALIFSQPAQSQEKDKADKDKKRGGTAIGVLTAKGPNFIEVKADGEEKGRKYVPHWIGGAPNKGGGPDKQMLKKFEALKVGSRLKVEWVFEEHLRVVAVEVLKKAKDD